MDTWVTAFGFDKEDVGRVLVELQQAGDIVQYGTFGAGDNVRWLDVQFAVSCRGCGGSPSWAAALATCIALEAFALWQRSLLWLPQIGDCLPGVTATERALFGSQSLLL